MPLLTMSQTVCQVGLLIKFSMAQHGGHEAHAWSARLPSFHVPHFSNGLSSEQPRTEEHPRESAALTSLLSARDRVSAGEYPNPYNVAPL